MKKLLFLLLICVSLEGCMLWPYKSDFDCPIPKGEHCKSLYEVNKLADDGKYSPKDEKEEQTPCECGTKQ